MKRIWGCLLLLSWVALAGVRGQDAPFTRQLSPNEYQAAGLDKLSPAERAKLDDLFAKYRSGAVAQAKAAEQRARDAEAAAAESSRSAQAAQAVAEHARKEADAANARAAAAAKSASSGSFLAKTKALLLPGTKIEYATVEAHVVGRIKGWSSMTVFLLDNGQRWQVADRSNYIDTKYWDNPAVTIKPAKFSGFELHIVGMGYMRVRLLSGPTYSQDK